MMIKKKSNPWARLKYAYVLPLAATAVVAFARPEFSNKMEEISALKVNDLKEIVETKVLENQVSTLPMQEVPLAAAKDTAKKKQVPEDIVFMVVDKMPEYPGGMSACIQFLNENIKYPKAAFEAQIEGRVIVTFVVNKDGSISKPEVVRSLEPSLDAEALRVVKRMPKWKPGTQRGQAVNVKFTVPITFNITGSSEDRVEVNVNDTKPMPLILIEGKEASNEILQALNPDKIASISVLKDKSATDIYGEKGKNGVLLIKLKPMDNHVTVAVSEDGLKVIGGDAQWEKTITD